MRNNIFKNEEISAGFEQLGKILLNKDSLNLDTSYNYKELTYELQEQEVICPLEKSWNYLWEVLQNKHITHKKLPEPLLSEDWHASSKEEKRARFFQLLKMADEHEKLHVAIKYLNKLKIKEFNLDFVIVL